MTTTCERMKIENVRTYAEYYSKMNDYMLEKINLYQQWKDESDKIHTNSYMRGETPELKVIWNNILKKENDYNKLQKPLLGKIYNLDCCANKDKKTIYNKNTETCSSNLSTPDNVTKDNVTKDNVIYTEENNSLLLIGIFMLVLLILIIMAIIYFIK